jgi:phage gpG-like protein
MPTIQQSIANLEALKRDVPKIVANEMVNYALDNIRKGVDVNGKPLKKRKSGSPRDAGRAILVDTGDGRRSITAKPKGNVVELTANDYMQAHNDGAKQRVNVRAHTRKRKGRSENVKSFTKQMNLPQRQFTGKSTEQDNRIAKVIQQRIIKACT